MSRLYPRHHDQHEQRNEQRCEYASQRPLEITILSRKPGLGASLSASSAWPRNNSRLARASTPSRGTSARPSRSTMRRVLWKTEAPLNAGRFRLAAAGRSGDDEWGARSGTGFQPVNVWQASVPAMSLSSSVCSEKAGKDACLTLTGWEACPTLICVAPA